MDYNLNYTQVGWTDVADAGNPGNAEPIDANNLSNLDNGVKEVFERTSDLNERTLKLEGNYNRVINFSAIPSGTNINPEDVLILSFIVPDFKKDKYLIFSSRCTGINANGNYDFGWTNVSSAVDGYIGLGNDVKLKTTSGGTISSSATMTISSDGTFSVKIPNVSTQNVTLMYGLSIPTIYMFPLPNGIEIMS